MAGKFREKAREVRKSLFKFFCMCSAATPAADDGEAPRQQDARLRFVMPRDLDVSGKLRAPVLDESIAVPRQSQTGDGKVPHQSELGLTRDVLSLVLKGRVPRQHVHHAPRAVAVPRQSQNVERRAAPSMAKAEIASIVGQMTGGDVPASVEEIRATCEFIEWDLIFTRSDLPVFQPSQAGQAPRPIFAPRATGAVLTPGAVFASGAVFTLSAVFVPGAGFPT